MQRTQRRGRYVAHDDPLRQGDDPMTREEQEQPATGRRRPWQSWENLVEERIREAQERGEFANIGGPGKPLDLSGDTTDPTWMANRTLKNAGFVPPALDLGREIDASRAAAAAA